MTKEERKIYNKNYKENNSYLIKIKRKEYRLLNADKIRNDRKLYNRKKRNSDSFFKLKSNISTLIRMSFNNKNIKKNTKTEKILGCSFESFKIHLESKFEPWMSWDNYGNPKDGLLEINKTWDIDHIEPISTAKTEEDVIKLNHHTNLQPLCTYNNRFIKNNR